MYQLIDLETGDYSIVFNTLYATDYFGHLFAENNKPCFAVDITTGEIVREYN